MAKEHILGVANEKEKIFMYFTVYRKIVLLHRATALYYKFACKALNVMTAVLKENKRC